MIKTTTERTSTTMKRKKFDKDYHLKSNVYINLFCSILRLSAVFHQKNSRGQMGETY